jgi:hypothetical protein
MFIENTQLVPNLREGHDYTKQLLNAQMPQDVDVLPPMREPLKNNFYSQKLMKKFS